MAKLTISDAARVAGVSRVTLHRYIKAGKLSRSADGTIDTSELLRVGLELHADTVQHPVTAQRPATSPATLAVTQPDTPTLHQLIEVLQRELDAAHAREEAAREREAMLLQMLQQMQHQNHRLLDAPRSAPAPPPGVPGAPPTTSAPRGEMRRRIVALLQDHPEGLAPAQIRQRLASAKSLTSTMTAMARDGLVRRVGYGRYALP